jgi:hypothetical protein
MIRGVELALEVGCKLQAGQQHQIASIRFHRTHGNDPFVIRAKRTYGLLTDEPAKLSAIGAVFFSRASCSTCLNST